MPKKLQVLSGSSLKIIAMISMLIDHIGAVVVYQMIYHGQSCFHFTSEEMIELYYLMRDIGRIAFPIYCFLLVEGFYKTKNRGYYFLRLLGLAIVSEIPFDYAFRGSVFDLGYQNIFFTLSIAYLCMWFVTIITQKYRSYLWLRNCLIILLGGMGGLLAEYMKVDYGYKGILCILVLYLFYEYKILSLIAGGIAFWWEIPAPLAFLPLALYNGKRGLKIKYLFYFFYPIHLIILGIVLFYMGYTT